jgi:hypothetical protein
MSDALKNRQIYADIIVEGRWIDSTTCHQFVTYKKNNKLCAPPTDDNVNKTVITLDGDIDLGRFPAGGSFAKQTDIVFTLAADQCNWTDSSGTPMVLDFPTDGSALTFPEQQTAPGLDTLLPFVNVQQSSSQVSFTDTDWKKGEYSYLLRVRCQYVGQNPPGTWYIDLDPKIVNPN